jgi:hypothetical protein
VKGSPGRPPSYRTKNHPAPAPRPRRCARRLSTPPPKTKPPATPPPAPKRARLAKLLRFPSSKSPDALTSLDEYVARMPEGQKQIYWISAASAEEAARSPFLEALVKKVGGLGGFGGAGRFGRSRGAFLGGGGRSPVLEALGKWGGDMGGGAATTPKTTQPTTHLCSTPK